MTALDVEEGDATLLVVPGSHVYHQDFAKKFNLTEHKDDWFKLDAEKGHVTFFTEEKNLEPVRIMCKAGDLVLWDSRTIHAGCNPVKGRANPKLRCVGYVCYTPRAWATKKDLEKKQKAFQEGRTTSHWPHKVKLFGKRPRTYGADTSQHPIDDINDNLKMFRSQKQRRLAGFSE